MKKGKLCRALSLGAVTCLTAGFLLLSGPGGSLAGGIQEVVFKVGEKNYYVNEKSFIMDASPFINQGRTYVPLRYLALALNVAEKDILWDKNTKTVLLTKDGVELRLTVGSRTITVNGQAKDIDVAPVIRDGRSYLPARHVAEALGYRVEWNQQNRTVLVQPAVPTGGGTTNPGFLGQVVVQGNGVNIRSGPGLQHAVVTQVNRGDRLAVLGKVPDWYQVQLPGGGTGWIVAWYVREEGQPADPGDGPIPGGPVPGDENSRGVPGGRPQPGDGGNQGQDSGGIPGQQPQEPLPDNEGEQSQSPAVTRLDVAAAGKVTRVTVTAEGSMAYHVFKLTSPDRLVVDLTGIRPGNVPPEMSVETEAVNRLRVGWFSRSPDVTRLVFDVMGPVRYRTSLSADGRTLEIQIYIPDPGDVLRDVVIAIDPGHGGPDPGAVNNGLKEKDITLRMAQRVVGLLAAKGASPLLTRNADYEVGLYERTDMANRAGAEIFVSIHINANIDPSVQGTATYILSSAGGGDPSRREESRKLAGYIQARLVQRLGLENDGVLEANFAVLRTSAMPAVLVEVAYISNPREASLLAQDWFMEEAAQGIVQGIVDYLSERWG
ncbi:N-acetylmuramoyl-L-alanine amidase [Desulfofundulus thermosubterraneus]|uniref:N-acetylmuramoyl-L-alanine amidase n=1 Tax=Desulfofundulus thermosubterraneus DSM 16057 TaxID=1121432 RepID=A0A1M6J073_9FIRM|nr:N-acetylmuramoyl-L-alanine amidase [Desulfofundulus thermosubterraneus]SHJ40103.1 N-acetylmuramoyl-L-alanine amidase [Desulfofundulus thermosubterraneus DSM 16057]